MKRAALYLRVSTSEQTIENQRRPLLRIAKARGYKVVATYAETGSGAKNDRPEYRRMMHAAHAGEFDVLIVWALDRMGRSLFDLTNDVLALERRGVELVSSSESWIDTQRGGMVRDLLIYFFSWAAKFERDRLIERVKAGLVHAKARGKRLGRPSINLSTTLVESLLAEDGATQRSVARALKVSPASVNRAIARARVETRVSFASTVSKSLGPSRGRKSTKSQERIRRSERG